MSSDYSKLLASLIRCNTGKDDGNKQQAQIKQINEQHRRQQENTYIEELAELISDSLTDMSVFSVKPDKCAILQETVNQIQQIKKQAESGSGDAVQQSQVSSSKPSIIANDLLGPLLLEALDGFLFVVNSQGKVEFVSENITSYLNYNQDDLVGKSVYNIIHVGDHAQFSNSLVPMSLGNCIAWPGESQNTKGRNFSCRMLMKPPYDEDKNVDLKHTYVSQYESMQITAILQPYLGEKFSESESHRESENQTCLVCIARRLPLTEKANMMIGIEQFTTRQDLNDKIIDNDTNGLVSAYGHIDFKGQSILEYCHANDVAQLRRHLQDVKKLRSHTSGVYRFKLQENRYVFVQTKSKLFTMPSDPDFIVSTHSIIRDCDSENELKGSASTSLMKSIIGQSNINNRAAPGNKNLANLSGSMGVLSDLNSLVSSPQLQNMEGLDLLNSNAAWDLITGADNSFGADFNLNSALGGGGSSGGGSVSTGGSTWDNMPSMKVAPQPLPPMPPQSQATVQQLPTGGQDLGAMAAKRQANFQQHRSQSVSYDDRKSPRFTPSPSGRVGAPYPLQSQRSVPGMMGYNGQRSPGAAGIGGTMHQQPLRSPGGQFAAPFPQPRKTVSPMMSPQAGVSNNTWPRLSMPSDFQPVSSSVTTQMSPQQSLQTMDTHSGTVDLADQLRAGSSEHLFAGGAGDLNSDPSSNPKVGKLCQLLTGKTSFDQLSNPGDANARSFIERTLSKARSVTDITRQSPQPGPGQSPPEKPQSTSNDDESGGLLREYIDKKNNAILMKLLSQEEDLPTMDTEISSSPHTRGSGDKGGIEMDKNEAEAKKPSNVLLKQLLSEDKGNEVANKALQAQIQRELSTPVDELNMDVDSKQKPTSELLQKLLLEEEDDEESCTSAPAESTIQDQEIGSGSRSRHQSGQQDPQSSGFSQPVTPMTPMTPQNAASFTDAQLNMLKDVFSDPGKKVGESSGMSFGQKHELENFLTKLWEKSDKPYDREGRPPPPPQEDNMRCRQKKRKSSSSDVDSTEVLESDASSVVSPRQQSTLTKNNALLAQLLSKKAAKETVVNTQLTVNPTALPQQKIHQGKSITDKFIHIRSNSQDHSQHLPSGEKSGVDKESSITPNPRDNPRTNPNAPFPGNTKPDGAMGGSDGPQMGQMNMGIPTSQAMDTDSASFEQFQQFFLSQANESVSMELEANGGDSSDPLLQQILQQAADLQQELGSGNLNPTSVSATPSVSSSAHTVMSTPNAPAQTVASQLAQHPKLNQQLPQQVPQAPRQQVPQQQQQASDSVMQDMNQLMDPWEEIDNILGINSQAGGNQQIGPTSETEQMAIDAIQRQLMSEEPVGGPPGQNSVNHIQGGNFPPGAAQPAANQPGQVSRQALAQLQMARSLRQQQGLGGIGVRMDPAFSQLQQQQQMQPPPVQGSMGQQIPGQLGPRFPQPQAPMGPLASALQGQSPHQRPPMYRGMTPTSTAIQVRQTLLHQQKLKQIEKQRHRQAQERQRIIQQQRLLQQKFGQFPGNMGVDGHFPETLGELMNSGHAPNVTLPVQRGQGMPGPMSPRYNPSGMPGGASPMSPMIPSTPPSQLSPHFSQQQQWNLHPQQQGNMQPGVPMGQAGQFGGGLQRHRSLSGNMPSPGGQASPRFQFPENQFPATSQQGGQLGMFPGGAGQQGPSQQQQQQQQQQQNMFAQNRLMQRQMSLPPVPFPWFWGYNGRGSPRTPHSPYGNSPDPMLMSPHSISPNSRQSQQPGSQVSPGSGLNQPAAMSAGFTSQPMSAPPSFTGQSLSTATSSFNQSLPSSSQGIPSQQAFQQPPFDMQFMETGSEGKKQGMTGDLNPSSNSTSQYVKQELRMICNARSEKQQLQTQQQQQQQQHLQQQADQLAFDTGELPLDILETINDMTKEHGGSLSLEDLGGEEDVLSHQRQEAKKRYEQFRALSTGQQQQAQQQQQQPPQQQYVPDDPEAKATSLFRNQLLCPPSQSNDQGGKPQLGAKADSVTQVNVVQREPRAPVDDIRGPEQKNNSLLQQLLSE